MKQTIRQLARPMAALALAFAHAFSASSAQASPPEIGPGGGRLIGVAPDQAEVVISPEGVISLTFLGADKKPVAPGNRSAAVFAQTESGKQEIALETRGVSLVSTEPLPRPEGYMLVIQTRAAPDAKPSIARIQYNMHICGGCDRREYTCTCEDH